MFSLCLRGFFSRLIGDSKLPIGVNMSVCLSLYVTDWRPVQGVPRLSGISSSTPATLLRISGIDNGWIDGLSSVLILH